MGFVDRFGVALPTNFLLVQGGFVQMVTFTYTIKCCAGNPACPVSVLVLGLYLQIYGGLKSLMLVRINVSFHVEIGFLTFLSDVHVSLLSERGDAQVSECLWQLWRMR